MKLIFLIIIIIFFFFVLCKPCSSYSSSSSSTSNLQPCPRDQSLALLQFKKMLSVSNSTPACIHPYPKTEDWKEGSDCCSWGAITCNDETGNVEGLDLRCGFIQGTLRSDYNASVLSHLRFIDLSFNSLNGTIPPWILNFPSLEALLLRNNLFTGTIGEISAFSLKTIDLIGNKLYGPIPKSIFHLKNLESLSLSSNNLSGVVDTDMLISNLKNLIILDLSDNKLYGPIPKSIFQLEYLEFLDLSSNNLTGVVDTQMFSKLGTLQRLDLSGNRFLSMSTADNNISFILPNLTDVYLSSCSIKEFPLFLKAAKNIVYLDLSDNQIYGPVPKWFYETGNDSLKYLSLSGNFFTKLVEKIPWNSIKYIFLQHNLLEGELPTPPNITLIYSVSNNNLTGDVPSWICPMEQVWVLDLSHNYLSGKIPPCLVNISNLLSVLDLRMNSFRGTIPAISGQQLETLNLNGNQLEGSLPKSLLNCSWLEVFDVGNNKLHGVFPHWLENLPYLKVLVLRSNSFTGLVRHYNKTNTDIFQQLQIFDISRNNFSGPFPTEYVKHFNAMMMNVDGATRDSEYINKQTHFVDYRYHDSVVLTIKGQDVELVRVLTILTTIDLSDNNFRGEIPEVVIGKLKYLPYLNLSHNNFTGRIPASVGFLENLEALDLSSNNFAGHIPPQLVSLTYLSFLNLSRNGLVGEIPKGKQFNTFQNDSYQGNLGLCGFPLTQKCLDDGDKEGLEPSGSQKDEDESVFNWVAISSGFAFGIVYGVVMGYFFPFRERQRWLLWRYR